MRKLLKIFAGAVLFVVLAAVLWPLRVPVMTNFNASEYTDYLRANHQVVELNGTATEFQFPASFYQQRLFLLGENHGSRSVQDLDLALIAHLQRELGLRWLMAEIDPLEARRFNGFLDTGDTTLIEPVFEQWLADTAHWGNQQFYEKLLALREFNEGLPADSRIRFFGVDWLGSAKLDEATSVLESGELDAPTAAYLQRNIDHARNEDSRYTVLLENIRAMVEDFGIGDDQPIYGLWGIFHVLKATVNDGAQPLAMRLAESDLPFADGIVSLSTVFVDSEQNLPSHILPGPLRSDGPFTDFPIGQDNPWLVYLVGIGDLKEVAGDDDLVIFHMSQPDSPYRSSARLRDQTGLLTKVFRFEISHEEPFVTEYVVLVSNSPAVDAFDP